MTVKTFYVFFFKIVSIRCIFCHNFSLRLLERHQLCGRTPLAVGPRGLMRAKWSSTPLCWLRQNKDVKKVVQHCNKKKKKEVELWAMSLAPRTLTGKCNGSWDRDAGCYICIPTGNTFADHMSSCGSTHRWPSPRRHHERFCGRVQEHLHGGPLQAGLRLRWRHGGKPAAPAEARREVQVFEASLPSPVEGEAPHLQLAAQVQAEEVDSRRHRGRTDGRYSSHSARWAVILWRSNRELKWDQGIKSCFNGH